MTCFCPLFRIVNRIVVSLSLSGFVGTRQGSGSTGISGPLVALKNVGSGYCISTEMNGDYAGAQLTQESCGGGGLGYQLFVKENPSGSVLTFGVTAAIVSYSTNTWIGYTSPAAAADPVQVVDSTVTGYQYQFNYDSTAKTLTIPSTSLGWDVEAPTTSASSGIKLASSGAANSQKFTLIDQFPFYSELNTLCMDVSGGSLTAGTSIIQNTCGSTSSTIKWNLWFSSGQGAYQIYSSTSNLYIGVSGSPGAGSSLVLVNQASALWFEPGIPNTMSYTNWKVKGTSPPLYITIPGSSNVPGVTLTLAEATGGNNQVWSSTILPTNVQKIVRASNGKCFQQTGTQVCMYVCKFKKKNLEKAQPVVLLLC